MPERETEGPVTLSVLDRLIDREPKNQSEVLPTYSQSLRELKAALRRDLEWLLNTRRNPEEAPESCAEVQHSVYSYGLPDICSLSTRSAQDQTRLLKIIESAISTFEPRLAAVKVSLAPVSDATRVLRFLIEGMLRVDPSPVHVAFDTALELTSGTYEVKGDAGAR